MKQKLLLLVPVLAGLFLLAGCGGGGGSSPGAAKNTLAESEKCIGCHDGTNSDHSVASNWNTPGTGKPIVGEWRASTHNTNNGASCQDCHGSGYMHPASCNKCHSIGGVASNPTKNPDQDAVCIKCHNKTGGYRSSTVAGVSVDTGIAHFTNLTTGTIVRTAPSLYYYNYTSSYKIRDAARGTAVWVSSFYNPVKGDITRYGCRACHNPHDTTSQIEFHRTWARSGHGDTNSAARTTMDFKTRGSTISAKETMGNVCVRCHTSTGFLNYIKSDFDSVKPLVSVGSSDHTKEVTGCNVCHDDGFGYAYSYKLRNVLLGKFGRSGVPAYYNYSTTAGGNARAPISTNVSVSLTYPDASNSNICIVCHMGREVGLSIKKAYLQGVNFGGTARINAHDFAAAANLFQESGFEFYSSSAKYPTTAFLHNKAGLNNLNGTGSNGPCITCHMSRPLAANGGKSPDSHTFMPITKVFNGNGQIETITSSACNKCHPSAAAGKIMDAATLENYRTGFKAAMKVLRDLINTKIAGVTISGKTGALTYNAKTNWKSAWGDNIVPGSGNPIAGGGDAIGASAYTMGAAYNYELLYFDFGSYVHNPNYIKRLIFDSYDWLHDGAMSSDNGVAECTSITDPIAKAYLCPSGKRP